MTPFNFGRQTDFPAKSFLCIQATFPCTVPKDVDRSWLWRFWLLTTFSFYQLQPWSLHRGLKATKSVNRYLSKKKSKGTVFSEDNACLVVEEPVHGEFSMVRCLKQNVHRKISNPTCMLPFLLHLSFNISEQKDASALLALLNNSHSGVHNQKQTPFLSICITFNHFVNQI